MNPLQTELRRLYLLADPPTDTQNAAPSAAGLIDAQGCVRAMVLEVAQLAGCKGVAALWQGVQDALDLPAPAIAVSGSSGFQLWFSLQEAIPVGQATAFLAGLRRRFLADLAPRHVVMWPAADASGLLQHASLVPAQLAETGYWSAFVAPGLLSMFADEPWLDQPPGVEAQAKLLANFKSTPNAVFRQAQQRLAPPSAAVAPDAQAAPADTASHTKAPESIDPKGFLLSVMNNPATELSLRIEAAKALLPYTAVPRQN